MSKYKVLGRGKSGSYFVECLLTEASIDYEFETYSFDQTKEIEFKSINPLSRTPVLIAPSGQIIIESVAIFAHLIETFPTLAPQVDTAERNAMWQQLGVLSTALFATWFRFHNTQFIGPEEIHQSIIDYIPHEEKRWLDYLENQLNPYLSGSSPMAVDFYFYMMTRWTPDRSRMLNNRPNIEHFISMMSSNNTVMTVNEKRGIKE